MATLRPLTLFPPFGRIGAGPQPAALNTAHVGHGSRSDDQASHAEQAAHGQLTVREGMLKRADGRLDGGPQIAAGMVFSSAAAVTL